MKGLTPAMRKLTERRVHVVNMSVEVPTDEPILTAKAAT